MNRTFSKQGWNDFVEWVNEDRKVARRIVLLLNDIERNGNEGLGKPEALRNRLSGYWSRRITEKDRLIYRFDESTIYVAAWKGVPVQRRKEPGRTCHRVRVFLIVNTKDSVQGD